MKIWFEAKTYLPTWLVTLFPWILFLWLRLKKVDIDFLVRTLELDYECEIEYESDFETSKWCQISRALALLVDVK